MKPAMKQIMERIWKALATGLGSGYAPVMPGTVCSALSIIIAYWFSFQAWEILLLCLAGVYICTQGEILLQQHDSPHIVFDEFCGILISTWQLHTLPQFAAAFVLFRFFDMKKPFPVYQVQSLPRGWGVMADDVAAGLITRLLIFGYTVIASFLVS